jgi:hypothetical protein
MQRLSGLKVAETDLKGKQKASNYRTDGAVDISGIFCVARFAIQQ